MRISYQFTPNLFAKEKFNLQAAYYSGISPLDPVKQALPREFFSNHIAFPLHMQSAVETVYAVLNLGDQCRRNAEPQLMDLGTLEKVIS